MIALNMETARQKLGYLVSIGREELLEILENMEGRNAPGVGLGVSILTDEYTVALEKLEDYFDSHTNTIKATLEFNEMRQKSGERIRDYEIRLRAAARKCGFVDPDDRIRERLLGGTTDKRLRRSAVRTKLISVTEIIERGRYKPNQLTQLEAASQWQSVVGQIMHPASATRVDSKVISQ